MSNPHDVPTGMTAAQRHSSTPALRQCRVSHLACIVPARQARREPAGEPAGRGLAHRPGWKTAPVSRARAPPGILRVPPGPRCPGPPRREGWVGGKNGPTSIAGTALVCKSCWKSRLVGNFWPCKSSGSCCGGPGLCGGAPSHHVDRTTRSLAHRASRSKLLPDGFVNTGLTCMSTHG
jgi:hypothetical protein